MDEDKFGSIVEALWNEVHNRIGPAREEAYKILGHMNHNKEPAVREKAELGHCYEYKGPLDDTSQGLSAFAKEGFTCARAFQRETERIRNARAEDVLEITTKAGVLLYYTEQILLRYNALKTAAQANKALLPANLRESILSGAMTIAATARDQIVAAEGYIKNLKETIGARERRLLFFFLLLPTAFVYLCFHPSLQLSLLSYGIPHPPAAFRIYWEILFWSLFGAISISFITISEDVMKDVFDPRHVYKYEYRIAVAPLVAVVLVFFVSLVGLTYGETTIKLDLTSPNIPVVVILSFLFGFFGKRSLDLLDSVWQKLFPSATEESKKNISATPSQAPA